MINSYLALISQFPRYGQFPLKKAHFSSKFENVFFAVDR